MLRIGLWFVELIKFREPQPSTATKVYIQELSKNEIMSILQTQGLLRDLDAIEWNLHHRHCGAFWGGNHDLESFLLLVLTPTHRGCNCCTSMTSSLPMSATKSVPDH